jgi:membrane protease YdiL (CAAX protease family)
MSGPLPTPPRTTTPFSPPLHGGDILRTILIGFGLFFATNYVLVQLVAGAGGGRVNTQIASFAAWTFSWLAAIWFVFVRGRGLSFADLGYTVADRRWALMGIGAGFGALPLAFVLAALLRPALGPDTAPSIQEFTGGGQFTVFHALVMLLYGGFVVPLTEELFFRGLLFRWLRQRLEFWPAAFVSAAAFGVAHGSVDKAIISGLLGLALAWLFERSRSLAPAILLHQTFNSLALMLTFAVIWLPAGTET